LRSYLKLLFGISAYAPAERGFGSRFNFSLSFLDCGYGKSQEYKQLNGHQVGEFRYQVWIHQRVHVDVAIADDILFISYAIVIEICARVVAPVVSAGRIASIPNIGIDVSIINWVRIMRWALNVGMNIVVYYVVMNDRVVFGLVQINTVRVVFDEVFDYGVVRKRVENDTHSP
jgi:hypothetical protein